MKTVSKFSLTVMLLAALSFFSGCKKKSEDPPANGPVPVVSTINYSNVLLNTADLSGNVTDDRGLYVSKHGFCWSNTNTNPTIQNDTMVAGDGAGSYTGTITGLKGQRKYYVRAFATNSNGTGYGSILTLTTIDTTITDIDNNRYLIVQIGTQVWMAENLKTTRYNDGVGIPLVTDDVEWANEQIGAYCYYNNDPANAAVYGALYNWFVVQSGNLAPAGWHVPTDGEWVTLLNFLGGKNIAGGKMKEQGLAHWSDPNTGADNSSGFSGLPGGERICILQLVFYDEVQIFGNWWSANGNSGEKASFFSLYYMSPFVQSSIVGKTTGYSIRCIRN